MLPDFKKIRDKLLQPKKVMGIDISILEGARYKINLSLLQLKKEEIQIVFTKPGLSDLTQIKDILPEHVPVALAIDGKGILNKQLAVSANTPDKDLIRQIIPGAKIEDFYLQKYQIGADKLWVSIIRQQTLDKIIQDFTDKEIDLIDINLGPIALDAIKQVLLGEQQDGIFQAGAYQLEYEAGSIKEITKNISPKEVDIQLGDDKISSDLILSYALAMQVFLDNKIGLQLPALKTFRETWLHKKLAKPLLYGVIGFSFLLILSNFLYFSYISSAVQDLSGELQVHKNNLNRLESLKAEVESKKAFLKETGWLQSSKTSYYADQLALSLPQSTKFNELIVYPEYIDVKNNRDKTLKTFESDKILINGVSRNSKIFNEWLAKIKTWQWVKTVNLLSYSQHKVGSKADFSVSIIL